MGSMSSRERVTRALQKKPVDRVPVFMWFHPQTRRLLANYLRVPEQVLDEVLGNDIRQIWVNNNYAMEGVVHENDGDTHTDQWGIVWERRYGFNQIIEHPIAGLERERVSAYRFPLGEVEELLRPMDNLVDDSSGFYLGCDVSPCAFEMYWRLRGMEDALLDFAGDLSLAETMVGRCVDFSIRLTDVAFRRYPLDWLWTGDDVAAQDGMIISPRQWRDVVKPHLKRLFDVGKRNGKTVAFHCCGALRPIIPDLIEIGLDVLNPIQAGCPGMEAGGLKADFGDSIAFMGGVDTEDLLPNATSGEVWSATTRLIDTMTADGGGFILAASHTVPPETPLENVFAMYDAAGITAIDIEKRCNKFR